MTDSDKTLLPPVGSMTTLDGVVYWTFPGCGPLLWSKDMRWRHEALRCLPDQMSAHERIQLLRSLMTIENDIGIDHQARNGDLRR